MPTEQPNQKPPKTPQDKARSKVLLAMYFQGELNDEILPKEKMTIFTTKLYQEWPPEMQEALRPYGAEMIR
jgi:hypothetical protein